MNENWIWTVVQVAEFYIRLGHLVLKVNLGLGYGCELVIVIKPKLTISNWATDLAPVNWTSAKFPLTVL